MRKYHQWYLLELREPQHRPGASVTPALCYINRQQAQAHSQEPLPALRKGYRNLAEAFYYRPSCTRVAIVRPALQAVLAIALRPSKTSFFLLARPLLEPVQFSVYQFSF